MTERRVYIILSANALPYASHCVRTLFANCLEPIDLTLITDGPEDKAEITVAVSAMPEAAGKKWRVEDKADTDARAAEVFAGHANIAHFRNGHPCWRKITDPLLYGAAEDEAIILDPDLYFPNKFSFEPTPDNGLLLMRQGPNCLYPPEAVARAFDLPVKLANHVDIGVGQVRKGAVDLDWFDWFVGAIKSEDFAKFMHIEAIVWSAFAMRMGGGYLDPKAWRCWQRGQVKRVFIAAGAPGDMLLKLEPLQDVKCIHVSGPSKWWVVDAVEKDVLKAYGNVYDQPTPVSPFVEYTHDHYLSDMKLKGFLRRIGYYKLTKSE